VGENKKKIAAARRGELNQREGERGNSGEYRSQAGLKIPTRLNRISKFA
jgi:hypothetical protein